MEKLPKTPLKRTTAFIAAIAALGLSQSASAQTRTLIFNVPTADWASAAAWYNPVSASFEVAPDTDDNGILYFNREANVTTAGNVIGNLTMGFNTQTFDGGQLNINAGDLTIHGDFTLASDVGGTGTLPVGGLNSRVNINGGTLVTKGSTNFSVTSATVPGTVNINSGTWNNEGTVNLSTAGSTAKGIFNINSGGIFTTTATTDGTNLSDIHTIVAGNSANRGIINLNGGTFNFADSNAGDTLDIVELNNTEINITSGAFNLDKPGAADLQTRLVGTDVNIFGDTASVDFHNLNAVSGTTFDFFMDSDGVSTITASGWMLLSGSTITVDGSSYAGGEGVFTLFDSTVGIFTSPTSANGLNFTGYDATFGQSGNDYIMTLTAVPEPGAFALFSGMLALGWVMIRRRK